MGMPFLLDKLVQKRQRKNDGKKDLSKRKLFIIE